MPQIPAPIDATQTPEWKALQDHFDALQAEGISLKDWFWPSRRVLAPQQRAAIKKAADFLEGEDLQALLSILKQFGTP